MNETTMSVQNPKSLYTSFSETVKSYLTEDKKKYPILFTFSQKVFEPKISGESFDTIMAMCWRESGTSGDNVFFSNSIDPKIKFSLNELPYERCNRVEYHEDYQTELPAVDVFGSFADLSLMISKLLIKTKRKIAISFPYPVFIPQLSVVPQKHFFAFMSINRVSKDNGATWANNICVFADKDGKHFYEASIIPYRSCLEIKEVI